MPYEALVLDTKKALTFILESLELTWDANVMRTSKRKAKLGTHTTRTLPQNVTILPGLYPKLSQFDPDFIPN
jgi:hypothetical protein